MCRKRKWPIDNISQCRTFVQWPDQPAGDIRARLLAKKTWLRDMHIHMTYWIYEIVIQQFIGECSHYIIWTGDTRLYIFYSKYAFFWYIIKPIKNDWILNNCSKAELLSSLSSAFPILGIRILNTFGFYTDSNYSLHFEFIFSKAIARPYS